jgi:colanic acid/amylovoran biosynthesis glycosyltransferase
MNILCYSNTFGFSTTTFIYNDVMALNAMDNYTVNYLCTNSYKNDNYTFDNVHTIPIERTKLSTKIKWLLEQRNIKLSFKNSAFKRKAQALIQQLKPNIIHCHFGYEALTLLDNCFDTNQKYLVQFHGYDASQQLTNQLYVNKLKHYGAFSNVHFATVSNYMQQELLSKGIKPYNPIQVLYCGIDTDFFTPNTTPYNNDVYTFLQVSSTNEKKGHIYTLQAFAKYQQQNPSDKAQLIIAGLDTSNGAVKQYAINNNLMRNVTFIGNVNSKQVKELMQNAHCFVHHSITPANNDKEGIPTVLMEAMAMNLPVISTLHAGIPELIAHKQNGLLVAEKDVNAYALAMKDISTYSFEPRTVVLNKFSKTVHINNLMAIYSNL